VALLSVFRTDQSSWENTVIVDQDIVFSTGQQLGEPGALGPESPDLLILALFGVCQRALFKDRPQCRRDNGAIFFAKLVSV
jgi:hypothetical protein